MRRKSPLYESKVEYGGWTINHVQGCAHGCRYPCYAMMLAKRTGRVKSYEEWCRPRAVENALELLDAELLRFATRIDSVHLCFTTDPFMYDAEVGGPVAEVVDLTTRIIERLNERGIGVTTLTKGVYPEDFGERTRSLSPRNQYGLSLVSVSEAFRLQWEPGSAPLAARIAAARRLAEAGQRTWASIEPYPTPNIDPSSENVEPLLEAVSFVNSIVFGRWNYSKLVSSSPDLKGHYARAAQSVASWCDIHGKTLHIKKGTPLSDRYVADVLGADPDEADDRVSERRKVRADASCAERRAS
ncbi:MAG: radical SAM protein [Thermoleophilia bacterium]|nr:radical SAM protein [Thermoleophilia bacterium]